jgi:MoaA/NifB/PqqE/SkfB family radical SAM enzyme
MILEREVVPNTDSTMETIFSGNSALGKLQSSFFDRGALFRLQLESASKCSADCSYCYAKITDPQEPLSTREIKNLLRRAAGLGIKQVDWMGGDPMERPDWIELMQSARYNGMTNNLWTCGPRLNDVVNAKRVIELTDGGFVAIHLDSLDSEVLSTLRDSYNPLNVRETLKGLELLLEAGKPASQRCNLIMLTNAQSVEDVQKTMETLYRKYGVRTCLMSLKPVEDKGRLVKLIPRPENVNAAYRLRDNLFLKGKSMGCQDFPKQFCGTTVFVSIDGKVSSCYSLRRNLGSIRDQTFEDIVARNTSSLLFTEVRQDDFSSHCHACDRHLCWGCRANAFYFGSGASSEDRLCQFSGPVTDDKCPY